MNSRSKIILFFLSSNCMRLIDWIECFWTRFIFCWLFVIIVDISTSSINFVVFFVFLFVWRLFYRFSSSLSSKISCISRNSKHCVQTTIDRICVIACNRFFSNWFYSRYVISFYHGWNNIGRRTSGGNFILACAGDRVK